MKQSTKILWAGIQLLVAITGLITFIQSQKYTLQQLLHTPLFIIPLIIFLVGWGILFIPSIRKYIFGSMENSNDPKISQHGKNNLVIGGNSSASVHVGDVYAEKQLPEQDKIDLIQMIEKLRADNNIQNKNVMINVTHNSNVQKIALEIEQLLNQKGYGLGFGSAILTESIKGIQVGIQEGSIAIFIGVL